MENQKSNQENEDNNNKDETALDLRNCSANYSGLEVIENGLPGSANGETSETITIVEWDPTLLRHDFQDMGIVYRIIPHEK